MQKHKRSLFQFGFSIIELILIIAVIGILSGIVALGYGNAQKHARTTQTINTASAYIDAVKAFAADNDVLPGSPGSGGAVCIPEGGTCCNGFSDCPGTVTTTDSTISNQFGEYVTGLPKVPSFYSDIDSLTYTNIMDIVAWIAYVIPPDVNDCGVSNILGTDGQLTSNRYTKQTSTYTLCWVGINYS